MAETKVTPAGGTCSGTTTITCNLGALANPGSASIVLKVIPTSGRTAFEYSQRVGRSTIRSEPHERSVDISLVTVAPASNIPALGAWAKMMLALTAAFLGLFMMRKE